MNWPAINKFTVDKIGAFLALTLIVMLPHFSARLPSALLGLLAGWLIWTQRAAFFANAATRRMAVIFVLLWIPMLVSVPASFDWHYSALVATAVPLYFLAGLALVHTFHADAQRLWLARWLTIAMLVWMTDGLIQYLVGRDLLGYPLLVDGRLTGVFRGNLGLSTIMAILLPISVWYLLRKSPLLVLTMFVVAGIVAVLVGTRNALVMMTIVAIGTTLRLPRRYRLALAIVALMVAGAISLSPAMQERLQRVTETKTTTFEYYDRILSGRLTIWDTVGHMVIDRPWTGVGAGMFAATYDRYSTRTDDPYRTGGSFGSPFHAHNIYLSIAAETGLLGLLGIIAAFILCVKWYYAASPSRREQAWPYAFGLLIALFPTSIEYTLYKHWFFPVPLLLLCATLAALGDETVTVPTPVRKWQG